MKTCLVVGSLNMDYTLYLSRFPIDGETIFGKKRYIQPGGKGANQAAALGKSSLVNSIMLGAVGNDNDGLTIKDIINKCHVNSAIITKTNVETGNATIVVNDNSENKIVIIAGANGELNIEDIDLSLIDKSDYIILQNEIKQEVNEFVINEAYKRHKIIIYNPAPYREIEEKTLLKVDYFIPNEVELSLYSNSNNVMDGVDILLSKGIKNVIVTLGKDGSMLKNKDELIKVPARLVKAVDTVAAGDTFVGYFVAGIASSLNHKEALELATKASSITVSRKGSIVSIPTLKEIYEKYN